MAPETSPGSPGAAWAASPPDWAIPRPRAVPPTPQITRLGKVCRRCRKVAPAEGDQGNGLVGVVGEGAHGGDLEGRDQGGPGGGGLWEEGRRGGEAQ